MGCNATVVVMMDGLQNIEQDPDFGKKLSQACRAAGSRPVDVSALGHVNAATVIETHHADHTVVVAVGGNYGTVLGHSGGYRHHEESDKVRILKELAAEMGYDIHKKRKESQILSFPRHIV